MPNYIFDKAGSIYDLPPSLADNKTLGINSKLQEKRNRLFPAPAPVSPEAVEAERMAEARRRLTGGGSANGSNLIDQAQSSLLTGGGRLADTYENIRQNTFGDTDFQLSPEVDRMSDQAFVDKAVGFTGRDEYNQDIQGLGETFNNADSLAGYWDVAKQAATLGPAALADSAGIGAELAAGGLLTAGATYLTGPVGGAAVGGLVFGKKIKNAIDKVEDTTSYLDKLKEGSKTAAKAVAKGAGRTSIATADITESIRQDYIKEHGEEPPASHYAVNVPVTSALMALEFGILSKFRPKFSKPDLKEMKESVKFLDKSHSLTAAKRILNYTGEVAKAAGAEAGQEYLQTWHEMLASKISAEDYDDFNKLTASAARELGKDENQTEAIVGSLIGAGAGGTLKGTVDAPKLTGGLALDATKATAKTTVGAVKTAGKTAQNMGNKTSYALLPQAERDVLNNDLEIRRTLVEEKSADFDNKIATVAKATSHQDLLADEDIAIWKKEQRDMGLMDEDLQDPRKLKALQDRLASRYKKAQANLKGEFETTNIGAYGKQVGSNLKGMAKKATDKVVDSIPEEAVRKTIVGMITAKDKANKALENLSKIKSSSARGLVDMGLQYTGKNTKAIIEKARTIEIRDLQLATKIIESGNPGLGKRLKHEIELRKKSLERYGQRTKDMINKDTMPPQISAVAETGTLTAGTATRLASALKQAMAGKVADKDTLAKIEKALKVYKASDAYQSKDTKGRIDETNMAVLEDKIENARTRLGREVTLENVDNTMAKAEGAGKAAANYVGDKATEAKNKLVELKRKQRRAAALKKGGKAELKKVDQDIENEIAAAADKKQKSATTKQSSVDAKAERKQRLSEAELEGTEAVAEVQAEIDAATIKKVEGATNSALAAALRAVDYATKKADQIVDKATKTAQIARLRLARTKGPEELAKVKEAIIAEVEAATEIKAKPEKKAVAEKKSEPEGKTLEDGKFKEKITVLISALKTDAASVMDFIPGIIKGMRVNGYTTLEDFVSLMEQFPGLTVDEKFATQLEDAFIQRILEKDQEDAKADTQQSTENDASVIMKESPEIENLKTTAISDADIVAEYEKTFKGCKK